MSDDKQSAETRNPEPLPDNSPGSPSNGWNPRRLIMIALAIPLVGLLYFYWSIAQQQRQNQDRPPAQLATQAAQSSPTRLSRPVSEFSLTNQEGETVTLEDLKGRPWVAYFFYTTCPGPCIAMNNQVRDALTITEQYPDLRFVGFSVDPEYDTPARLHDYGEEFEFDPEHWTYLTGEETEVYRLAKEDFLLPVVETPEQLVASEGPFTHSTKFALINKNGFIVEMLDGMDPEFASNLKEALLRNGM